MAVLDAAAGERAAERFVQRDAEQAVMRDGVSRCGPHVEFEPTLGRYERVRCLDVVASVGAQVCRLPWLVVPQLGRLHEHVGSDVLRDVAQDPRVQHVDGEERGRSDQIVNHAGHRNG